MPSRNPSIFKTTVETDCNDLEETNHFRSLIAFFMVVINGLSMQLCYLEESSIKF